MYWLMSIDAIVRIAFAMTVLFIIVPALALPRHPTSTFLERFFWNFGIGITAITLVGQILTIAGLFSLVPLLLVTAAVIVLGQSAYRRQSPPVLLRRCTDALFLAFLNVMDGRVNVARRIRRKYRRTMSAIRRKTESRPMRLQIAGWLSLTATAAAFRLYRPLASANLGLSDVYVHLYYLKLLQEGQQVDPAAGPYPRGMHFLLMAIHHLTNVDLILLMNFFGVFVGVLMTLAVADAVRRLSRSVAAGLLAGFLFATFVGGPSQQFVIGSLGRGPGWAELDLGLTAFHRQASTLPQELALVLLFPAAMFLRAFLRHGERWHLLGFAGCTAAIAAVHSGVVLPLLLMSVLMILSVIIERTLEPGAFRRAVLAGGVAVLIGSVWLLAFIAYPYIGPKSEAARGFRVLATFYTPFIEALVPGAARPIADTRAHAPITPLLAVCIVLAIALIVSSLVRRDDLRANRIWISLVFLLFVFIHLAPTFGLPQLLAIKRNSQWLTMSMFALLGVGFAEMASLLRSVPKARIAITAAAIVLLAGWTSRVPRLSEPVIRDRIVDVSGYGGSTLALLNIDRRFEPYTWTLISYGQEFPMVLRRGFHLSAAEFLETYDPTAPITPIPTPRVFIIVEKRAHPFEINLWTRRFNRSEVEQRLQTWIYLYQTTHRNLRVFLEDEDVRVYEIYRTPEEIEKMTRQAVR